MNTDTLSTHWSEFKGLAQRIVKEPSLAEDVVQTAFIKALNTQSPPLDETKLLPWFKSIVRHAALDMARSKQRSLAKSADIDLDSLGESEDFEDSACRCVLGLLEGLSDTDQNLLRRLDIDEDSPKELAAELGITSDTLKVRRHRARGRLKQIVVDVCKVGSAQECLDCNCN